MVPSLAEKGKRPTCNLGRIQIELVSEMAETAIILIATMKLFLSWLWRALYYQFQNLQLRVYPIIRFD